MLVLTFSYGDVAMTSAFSKSAGNLEISNELLKLWWMKWQKMSLFSLPEKLVGISSSWYDLFLSRFPIYVDT